MSATGGDPVHKTGHNRTAKRRNHYKARHPLVILALRLKKLRNKRNITQEHLAEMADLSTVYISYAM